MRMEINALHFQKSIEPFLGILPEGEILLQCDEKEILVRMKDPSHVAFVLMTLDVETAKRDGIIGIYSEPQNFVLVLEPTIHALKQIEDRVLITVSEKGVILEGKEFRRRFSLFDTSSYIVEKVLTFTPKVSETFKFQRLKKMLKELEKVRDSVIIKAIPGMVSLTAVSDTDSMKFMMLGTNTELTARSVYPIDFLNKIMKYLSPLEGEIELAWDMDYPLTMKYERACSDFTILLAPKFDDNEMKEDE